MRQRGFSLSEFMLALTIASITLAMVLPPILRAIDVENEKNQINSAVSNIFDGMSLALTTHWQRVQCRSAPTLTLTDLINDYGVPANVNTNYAPRITFVSAPTAPYNARSLRVTLNAPTDSAAHNLSLALNTQGRWLTITGKRVTLTQPIAVIDSLSEHMNYNPKNGCLN